MCTHRKWITTHEGKRMLVPCGKCPACKQQKAAARTARIRNHVPDDGSLDCLFFGLTYRNKHIPYIRRSDLEGTLVDIDDNGNISVDVPVYRDYDVRWVRTDKETYLNYPYKKMQYHDSGVCMISKEFKVNKPLEYATFQLPSTCNDAKLEIVATSQIEKLPRIVKYYLDAPKNEVPVYDPDKISICYYKDLQNFFKRLRQILIRSYNCHEKFSFYCCSEYGSSSGRSHFHVLLFFPRGLYQVFKSAICQAWSFDDYNSIRKKIQRPIDAAAYVSSYVNSDNSATSFFKTSFFKQKHSYSQGFGLGKDYLSLDKVQESFNRRDFGFDVEIPLSTGMSSFHLFIPKYALNRYYPKFKGYHRLTADEIYDVSLRPSRIRKYRKRLELTEEECYSIETALLHKQDYWLRKGYSPPDFALFGSQCYAVRSSNILRWTLEHTSNWFTYYDNIVEYYAGEVSNDSLDPFFERLPVVHKYVINPNEFDFYRKLDVHYTEKYYKYDKSKKIRNSIYKKHSNV